MSQTTAMAPRTLVENRLYSAGLCYFTSLSVEIAEQQQVGSLQNHEQSEYER